THASARIEDHSYSYRSFLFREIGDPLFDLVFEQSEVSPFQSGDLTIRAVPDCHVDQDQRRVGPKIASLGDCRRPPSRLNVDSGRGPIGADPKREVAAEYRQTTCRQAKHA